MPGFGSTSGSSQMGRGNSLGNRTNQYGRWNNQEFFMPNRQQGGGMGGANSATYARQRTPAEQRMARRGYDPGIDMLSRMGRR